MRKRLIAGVIAVLAALNLTLFLSSPADAYILPNFTCGCVYGPEGWYRVCIESAGDQCNTTTCWTNPC